MNPKVFALALLLSATNLACQLGTGDGGGFSGTKPTPVMVTEVFSMNSVKMIRPDITNGADSSTMLQAEYALGSSSRLLLKLNSFMDFVNGIKVAGGKIWVQVTPADQDLIDSTVQQLQLCPLTKPWMMAAIWVNGYPMMGNKGAWQGGGEFDAKGCVKGSTVAPTELEKSYINANEVKSIYYNVSSWFKNYPQARGKNFGLILVTDSPTNILGDQSGEFSPRFIWNREK